MAGIYLKMKNFEKAKEHSLKATRTGTQNVELLCISALVEANQSNLPKAKKLIQSAFEMNPYQDHAFVEEAKTMLES